MKIIFHGAAETTTGSQHLIEVNGQRILLDCGLYQGHRGDAFERNRKFPFDPKTLDAVILSHAHIDHSGNLPNLVKQGFAGNIYATDATRDLCSIMLPDSAHIQESDVKWLNKKREKQKLPLLEPTYNRMDAEKCLRQFVTINYHRPMPVADGVKFSFIDAGHILGAAQVILDIDDRETGKKSRLLFSGDVGRPKSDLLNPPEPSEGIDYVIMESTYGGREHEMENASDDRICEIINATLERNGKILIPAFAVERTQQLLYSLNKLRESNCFPPIPIFVDSPLAVSATEIFRLHPECFNQEVYQFLFEKRNPFGFEGLRYIREANESRQLNDLKEPAVIIAASGMCESGRILHHLRNHVGEPSTTVLFVGYCAEHTLGWKLRNGARKVNILGDEFVVNARIEIMDSYSGHADHSELLDWFSHVGGPKKQVFLVHGEPERSEAFRTALALKYPSSNVRVAKLHETVTL
ncbi:metallo-beta-lactamase family protein [Roseimicrobium gellanilyticum]|uniref:Metallo-beta-lactamase family protein n=1 Tax=Roseimicrobium gellanilyticum TaxID=748857 RepID=A0A366HT79_9BACT|nr:MBL fold metallo-hydrolase [Roseimicrobium gellanilyticum]RBP47483.1 metallo-beta-lactamase family protein [Roseimicrobium gellanilyticum]